MVSPTAGSDQYCRSIMELTTASPRVVVAGWSGTTNLGDELLLRALLNLLAEKGWTATVVSRDPVATAALHDVDTIALGDLGGLWGAVRNAHGVVLGPGTLLQDQTSPASLPWHLSRIPTAALAGRRVVGVGLGIGPLRRRGSRTLVGAALGRCAAVAVRDPASAALAASCGVRGVLIGCDLALGLPRPSGPTAPRIVAALRAHAATPQWRPLQDRPAAAWDPSRIAGLAAALDDAAAHTGLPVCLVAFDTEHDTAYAEAVARHLTSDHEVVVPDLDNVLEVVGTAEVVVAMRYHAGVAALAGGRPMVLIDYAAKVRGLGDDVAACGGAGGMRRVADDPSGWAALGAAVSAVAGRGDVVAAARDRIAGRLDAHRRALDALDAAGGSR